MVGSGPMPPRMRVSHQRRRETEVRRRNGKLQSCEPCRKSKLRCDHMTPTCGRCARRNKPELCVYHPAPLTKILNQMPTPATSHTATSDCSSPHALRALGTTSPFTPAAPTAKSSRNPPLNEALPPRGQRATSLPSGWISGVLGTEEFHREALPAKLPGGDTFYSMASDNFLSHYALLVENEGIIGIAPPVCETVLASNIPKSHIEKGALVLSLLKDMPLFEKYMEKWFSLSRGVVVIEPMMKMWMTGLWQTWQKVLKTPTADGLHSMSQTVWQNTLERVTPLLHRHPTPRAFTLATTGESLRWEIVGIILTLVGLLASTLQDGDPIFCTPDDAPVDRAALTLKMFNASEICLKFCMDFDIINDLQLWFLFENTILSSSVHAKGSFYNYQKRGQLCNALVALNLHQEIKVNKDCPFFISEFRKRLFVTAYENDKYNSACIGRPPHLTRKYCRIQFPLDLSDAETMSDGLDLEDAIGNLDDEGWNQKGTIQRCTFSRLNVYNAIITEEILEISLGIMTSEEILQRAPEIEAKAIRLWDTLPGFLKFDGLEHWDTKRAPVELMFLAYIRLDYFGHHFLLQRTLIKKVGADSVKLLSVARQIFDYVLIVMNHRDMLREYQMDISQILCMYGIPAAAVVAVELLHQDQNPSAAATSVNRLRRSDTIQGLSILVSCLGTVGREWGAHAIIDRGKRFLKKIIDTVLEPTPVAGASLVAENPTAGVDAACDTFLTAPLFQTGSDSDFLKWLDSMEWEQDSWVNFT